MSVSSIHPYRPLWRPSPPPVNARIDKAAGAFHNPSIMPPDLPDDIDIFDADGALSREFLLSRGYCCKNGCRNCPYGFKKPAEVNSEPDDDTPSTTQ